jgi:hypothetical protein
LLATEILALLSEEETENGPAMRQEPTFQLIAVVNTRHLRHETAGGFQGQRVSLPHAWKPNLGELDRAIF